MARMARIEAHFFSEKLGMCVTCNVIIPQRREENAAENEKFKTLWLLHGYGDDESTWLRRTNVERYASEYSLAVVMPCVHLSAYADMVHGGAYYSFVSEELPKILRSYFPLSEKREDNFIAGLSMGGHGALKIGLSHAEAFGCIGCFSAGCINHNPKNADSPAHLRRMEILYGNRETKGTEEDLYGTAEKLLKSGGPFPRIYHCCGTEDFMLDSARVTRDYFASIPSNPFGYVYEEDKGAHTWEYWDEHIKHFIAFLGIALQGGILA